jgi:hypothetical protein
MKREINDGGLAPLVFISLLSNVAKGLKYCDLIDTVGECIYFALHYRKLIEVLLLNLNIGD